MAERYICIHGHFYQPPRENPWLEAVERQDSAYPYHDWNERITAECYEQNAAARILDERNQITRIVNNYARISFNFGPTLLSWLQQEMPAVYRAILAADAESRTYFNGHGAAIAQCYNHIIMPLASRRDKETQIIWGIRDFQYRFGRMPEGMWLPETAVDLETLDILAEHGVAYIILEPQQAAHIRAIGDHVWSDMRGGRIDPSRAYQLRLASGRSIAIFFYDGPISRAVAFERLLSNGVTFANRIAGSFGAHRRWSQLAHIATDGETYGHHHRHGDMALAYAIYHIEARNIARLTNYGDFLAQHPPTHEVQIIENTAWSCAHGVGRWKTDCGCNSGGNPGWNQAWRAPLRESLDWLRDTLAPRFEGAARRLLHDPWAARNDYIDIILERNQERIDAFLQKHSRTPGDDSQNITVLKLMELQRNLMLMYTSCGWFFDDISGIETVQVLMYAGRAIQLAHELFGEQFEPPFLERLAHARSNLPARGNGRRIYEENVRPATVSLPKVGAHYAISSLFKQYADTETIYCYRVEREAYHLIPSGKARLALGRIRITSLITGDHQRMTFGVLHLGDHNISGGVQEDRGDSAFRELVDAATELFLRADMPSMIRLIDRHFGNETSSLKQLLGDEQREILERLLDTSLAEASAAYQQIYENHAPLLRFLASMETPIPREFQIAAEFAINTELRRQIEADYIDRARVDALLREAERSGIRLDDAGLGYALGRTIDHLTELFEQDPTSIETLRQLESAVDLAVTLPTEVDVWKTQNVFYALLQTIYPDYSKSAGKGSEETRTWVDLFTSLCRKLRFRMV
jgi:alpha-amylase/alpha-mannosidase (GH57 family)